MLFPFPNFSHSFGFRHYVPNQKISPGQSTLGNLLSNLHKGSKMFFNLIMEKKKFPLGPDTWVEVIHFGYNPESAAASLCSRNHPPDYCMGYTGIEIVEANPEVTFIHDGAPLVFRHYSSTPNQILGDSILNVFWSSFTLDSRIASFDFQHSSILEKAKWFLSKLSMKESY